MSFLDEFAVEVASDLEKRIPVKAYNATIIEFQMKNVGKLKPNCSGCMVMIYSTSILNAIKQDWNGSLKNLW